MQPSGLHCARGERGGSLPIMWVVSAGLGLLCQLLHGIDSMHAEVAFSITMHDLEINPVATFPPFATAGHRMLHEPHR